MTDLILCAGGRCDYVSPDQIIVSSAQMRHPILLREPGMPAHVLAQLLESDLMTAEAATRFRSIMAREGADFSTMLTPGSQAPMRWFREAYPALQPDDAAYLGYSAGQQARLTSYSLLSLPIVSAGSISEVLRVLQFVPLISNAVSVRFFERQDSVQIMLSTHSGDTALDQLAIFYIAAALIRLLGMLSSDSLDLTIRIAWPQPDFLREHPECLAGRLRFNALTHHIAVPKTTLERVCRFSDPIAYRNAVKELQSLMAGLHTSDDIVARVTVALDHRPGLTGIGVVAKDLNLSVSTLKRRLAASGTHFSEVLEDTLRDRAVLMLAEPSMSLDAVASELGYSDLANFSHAFKRWTGIAPGAFRRGHHSDFPQS